MKLCLFDDENNIISELPIDSELLDKLQCETDYFDSISTHLKYLIYIGDWVLYEYDNATVINYIQGKYNLKPPKGIL